MKRHGLQHSATWMCKSEWFIFYFYSPLMPPPMCTDASDMTQGCWIHILLGCRFRELRQWSCLSLTTAQAKSEQMAQYWTASSFKCLPNSPIILNCNYLWIQGYNGYLNFLRKIKNLTVNAKKASAV